MATQRVKIPLVGGSYRHGSLPFDAQETINLFPERGGAQSKSPSILRRTPGLKNWITLSSGTGPIRGMYETSDGRLFAVRSNNLIEISAAGVQTSRGTINIPSDRVAMTDNGIELAIADETNIWSYTLATDTLATVTNIYAPQSTPVLEFIDGYIFGFDPTGGDTDPDTGSAVGVFRHSNLNDINDWLAIDVYTAEGSPDKIVTLKAVNRQLWIFGSKSFEVWYNAGGDNAGGGPTWARIPGTFTQIGCAAQNSVSEIRGKVFWLGSSKDGENVVWMSGEGYAPVQISNKAMESTMETFSSVDDAWSFTFEYLGHYFYCLTFQTGDRTYLYDITEGEWVNWMYRDTVTGEQGRHRALVHSFFDRRNFVGDYVNGNIYELDRDTYTDNGNPIVWERYFPYTESLNRRITMYSLFIDFLTGEGLLSGQGSDPKIQIRWSIDGARVFGDWEQLGVGVRGDYSFQTEMRMMGQGRSWVFHIRSSEPIPMSIQDNTIAEMEISED